MGGLLQRYSFRPRWGGARWQHPAVGLAVAGVTSVAVAALTQNLVRAYPDVRYVGALAFLQILCVALTWGLGAALLATASGAVLQNAVVLAPMLAPGRITPGVLASTVIFLLVGLATGAIASQAEVRRRRLAGERDQLQRIIDVLPEGVLIADATPRVLAMNAAAKALLGSDLTGRPLPAARLGEGGGPGDAVALSLARALVQGAQHGGEQLVVRHAGTGRDTPVLASSASFCPPDGAAIAVVTLRDIAPLRAFEREKEAFLASAAHDLRNPLAAVFGISQVLQLRIERRGKGADPQILDGLRAIERAAGRMNGQITELLDHSRLQLGQPLDLARHAIDLGEMLERIVLAHQQAQGGHRIRLQAAPHVTVLGDAARLERAIANILSNAIKYSPRGTTITASLAWQEDHLGRWALLGVADQGVGIPAADLPRVFERFYRASNVAHAVAGTGLGLAGVRQIVQQHGGTVVLTSEEGQGTTVRIRLPAGPPKTSADATTAG